MSQSELLKRVTKKLDSLGMEYMVTGAIASSVYGEPRTTHDIDLVIAIKKDAIPRLLEAFSPPDYYLSESSVREAVAAEDMFTLFDRREAAKVDFWVLTNSPFDRSRFARRCIQKAAKIRMTVSSPEDTILMKVWWAKQCGRSEKQFMDALRVYEVQHGKLDMRYLEEWAKRLRIRGPLNRLKDRAKGL